MIAYAARRVGERELESAFTHLPLKLNSAGVVPVVIVALAVFRYYKRPSPSSLLNRSRTVGDLLASS